MKSKTLQGLWLKTALGEQPKRILLFTRIIFFSCIILLYLYLLSVRFYSPLPEIAFWIPVVTAILSVVFQAVTSPSLGNNKFLLFEIIVLGFSLDLIYLIPLYGLSETDSYNTMICTRKIVEDGYVPSPSAEVNASLTFWPLTPIWGTELQQITGISTFFIAKWLPTIVIHSILLLLLYVFVKNVFKDQRVALLTALLISTVQTAFHYSVKFHYENFGQVIMMVLLIALTLRTKNTGTRFIILLSMAGVIFAHHFVSLILIAFLIIHLVVMRITGLSWGKVILGIESRISQIDVSIGLVLLASVLLISYWLYVYTWPLTVIARWGEALLYNEPGVTSFQPGYRLPQALGSLSKQIIFWGFYFFNIIFGFLLLYKIFIQRKCKTAECYSLVSVLFICAILGFIQVYLRTATASFSLNHFRLINWGWIFGAAPLVVIILRGNLGLARKIGIILLVGFMVFNVYQMDNICRYPQASGRETGDITLMEDYNFAETLPLTDNGTTYHRTRLAVWDIQGFLWEDLISVPIEQLDGIDWIVIKKKEFEQYAERGSYDPYGQSPVDPEKIDKLQLLMSGESMGMNKVFDSNNLVAFRRG